MTITYSGRSQMGKEVRSKSSIVKSHFAPNVIFYTPSGMKSGGVGGDYIKNMIIHNLLRATAENPSIFMELGTDWCVTSENNNIMYKRGEKNGQ